MELLYFYALAHQDSFDVRWMKTGSVQETIIAPLAAYLQSTYGDNFKLIGGARVTGIDLDTTETRVAGLRYTKTGEVAASTPAAKSSSERGERGGLGEPAVTRPERVYAPWMSRAQQQVGSASSATENLVTSATSSLQPATVSGPRKETGPEECSLSGLDACVLALGCNGLKSVLRGSSALARQSPSLTRAAGLNSIDAIACRLWLDRKVPTRSPANVFSRFDALRGAGGTFFMLDQLQDPEYLWKIDAAVGKKETVSATAKDDTSHTSLSSAGESKKGSVVSCDFYNAGALLPLSDDHIVQLLTQQLLPAAVPAFSQAKVIDSHVQRFPSAVSWFSPGSAAARPRLEAEISNLVCAGDWVRMGAREHGAKGLCQERAFVCGIEAANSLTQRGLLQGHVESSDPDGPAARVETKRQYGGPRRMRTTKRQYRTQSSRSTSKSSSSKSTTTTTGYPVIPIREDEPQVRLGRLANKKIQETLPFNLGSFWVR